ncbi:MAG: glycosyltransferase [Verrucomicrobia bacterium]|nr:glycosyltransferase [Verrucomicrobiota bacterium]
MQETKNKPRDPAVSVLVAVYNCAPYLPAALDSVLCQSFADFEILVVDDASTDETPAILRAYAQRDNRFVLRRNERNLKLAASLNRGLAVCRAPLIARADGDDLCHPRRLERQVEFLSQHPEVGAVSSSYNRIAADGRAIGFQPLPTESAMIKFRLLWESSLSHAGVLYRASEVRAVGGYDGTFITAQDYDLWARLAERTEFANLREPLLTVRTHAACATTVRASETQKSARSVSRRMLSRYLGRVVDEHKAAALRTLLCAYDAIAADEVSPALALLEEMLERARKNEKLATWRWAKRELCASLLKQAHYLTYTDPTNSWQLLRKVATVHARGLCSTAGTSQIARLLLRHMRRAKFPASAGASKRAAL